MKPLSLEEIVDIELAERYANGISKDLMLRAAHTAREYHRLREAANDLQIVCSRMLSDWTKQQDCWGISDSVEHLREALKDDDEK